ncbi:DUF3488 and transglutaminase-like domain-containing protein [Leucobacter japonicus]|uniref:DUF3488 and transglutaminase-like domain-containing protein n=1 Tax=Leucobacter japonicus TaxID=1461259 RepID=UPI0006A7C747|nr:DUF3488 and transglutaminase-like domain-containing protein [Leucobacter japonicus]
MTTATSPLRSASRPQPVQQSVDPERRRSRLWSSGLLLVLWGVVLAALTTVLEWGGWWFAAMGVITGTVIVSAVVRARHRRPVYAALAGTFAGALGVAVWVWGGGRAALWWSDATALLEQAQLQIVTGSAPLTVDGPLSDLVLAVVLLMAAATVFLADAADTPLIAGGVVALVLLVPSAVTGVSAGSPALIATTLLLALLAAVSAPRVTWQGGVAALVVTGLAAGIVAALPASRDRLWNDSLLAAPVSQSVPDVTLALAEDLRARSSAPVFIYRSSVPGPLRFTLATLADFEGGVWQPENALTDQNLTDRPARAADSVPAAVAAEPGAPTVAQSHLRTRTVQVTVEGLLSSWLPLPQSTERVAAPGDAGAFQPDRWNWAEQSNTVRSERDITRRDSRYTATATPLDADRLPGEAVASLTPAALSRLDPASLDDDSALAPYLALPEGMPAELSGAAAEVVGSASDRLAVGHALQDWFRSGSFAYSESAPYEPGANPDDPYAVMTEFLTTRSGFCVHYAATFAVMARELGVPTRVAVGYASRAERDDATRVLGRQLHAWPEIYVDDLGWVSFEPTPGGAGATADGTSDTTTANSDAAAPADDTGPTPTSAPQPSEQPTLDPTDPVPTATDSPTVATPPAPVALLFAACALLALIAVPSVWRGMRRSRRLRRLARGDRPGSNAWDELRDTARDLGWLSEAVGDPPRARTSTAWIDAWEHRGALTASATASARSIAHTMERERYGPGERAPGGAGEQQVQDHRTPPDAIAAELQLARRSLRASAGLAARLRAAVLPRSLGRPD